jgi:hypothetical protein
MGGSMSLVLSGDTSGTITVDVPAVAGTNTLNLPAKTGNIMVDGPAFSAYQSTLQSVSNATFTKVLFQTELWDTNNNFASSTFTPTVAGYYQINGAVQFAGVIAGIQVLAIYKNNGAFVRGPLLNLSASYGSAVSGLVYANGTTDYFELFAYQGGGTASNTDPTSATTWFQAALVRGA